MTYGAWQLALALWRDARSITKTGKYLGMTEHQVRVANKRNFEFLTRVLSVYHPHGGVRRQEMESTELKLEPRALFKRAIFSPGDEAPLRMTEQRAWEVMDILDAAEAMD